MAVTETWLYNHIYNNEILPSGYSIFRTDLPTRGGGMLLATSSHLPVCLLHSQTDPDIITIKIHTHPSIITCTIYVPPSPNESSQLSLINYLHNLFSSSHTVIVLCDFNCPDINWDLYTSTSEFSHQLCDLVFDLELSQIIDAPTHTKRKF